MKFYHLKDYDSLSTMDSKQLQVMVEDYVMDLKKRVNPNSVPTYVNPLQTFLDVNENEIKWKKIRRLFPAKIKSTGRKAYTREDIARMLALEPKQRNRVIIHILSSTGMRKGALPDLRIKHLKKMEHDCYSFLVYEGSTEEHWSFLTPEASKELDLYFEKRKNDGEKFDDNSPVFRMTYQIGIQKVRPMTNKAIDQTVERIVKRAKLREKNGNRYDKMLNHGFRKRFETIVKMNKEIPVAVSEKLIGHKAYYDDRGNHIQQDESYFVPEVEQLFQFFEKIIPDLTIDNSSRKQAEIDMLKQEKNASHDQSTKINELESKLEMLTHKIDLINNTKEV
jgi:integrase/recombinase XerD